MPERIIRFVDADNSPVPCDLIVQSYYADSSDDDVDFSIPGPGGFPGAQLTFTKEVLDNSVVITPRNGTIENAASYSFSAVSSVTFESNGKFGDEGNWALVACSASQISPELQIGAGDDLTYSPEEYDGTSSFQPIAIDLNLAATAGSSTDPKYIAPIMGNVFGDTLTKTKTYIGGLIGKLSILGSKLSTYPWGAVIGEVGDGVEAADAGAVVAVLGGDSAVTGARAAFLVDNQNSTPGSGFDYIVAPTANHDSYGAVVPRKAWAVLGFNAGSLPIIFATGVATDDAGIVAQVGADNTIADGSFYLSCPDNAGKTFQKVNDVWIDAVALKVGGNATDNIGYLNVPQNSQSAAYGLLLTDAGKSIYHPVGDANNRQYTIPANGTIAFPVGTVISFINDSPNDVTVVITTDVLAYADMGTITTLTIPQFNMATITKVLSNRWLASGTVGCTTV